MIRTVSFFKGTVEVFVSGACSVVVLVSGAWSVEVLVSGAWLGSLIL